MSRHSKGPSFSRSKRKIPKMSNVTIGTHVSGRSNSSTRRASENQNTFSSAKKTARAQRGIVEQISPNTSSGESVSDFAKRVNKPHYTKVIERNARIRGIVIVLVVAVIAVGIAAGIGAFAYAGSVSDKMSLGDSNARSALVAPKDNKPYYILLAGEFYEPGREYIGPSLLMLLRVDEEAKQVSALSIPANYQMLLSDGGYHRVSEAQLLGGDAALIKAVSEVSGVPVSHFVKTDKEGFVDLVDSLGGITVDVSEEVDDPHAGAIYIPAGTQELDGEAALTLCRATNFPEGEEKRAGNQAKVAVAVGQKLLEANQVSLVFTLDGIASDIKTDYSAGDFMALMDKLRGIAPENIYTAQAPGYFTTSTATGVRYFITSDASWEAMKTAFAAGQRPTDVLERPVEVDPGSFSIIVRNGTGVTGQAQQIADILGANGFQIKEVGNADLAVYDETLIVYNDDNFASAAQAVAKSLGVGRAIPSNSFYSFESDVLVVVGKDWKPLN